MKSNEISAKELNADAQSWIEKLREVLLIQDNGKGTVKNYIVEMILLFKYYNSKTVENMKKAGSTKQGDTSHTLRTDKYK